jgi:type II secretory pathway component GspD/PulD (secretin)
VKASPDAVAEIRDILKLVDIESAAFKQEEGVLTAPQIQVYPVSNADPATVLAVLQTLLAGQPDCRLTLDPKSNSIVAQARVEQHQTIQATLAEMQNDYTKIEIFNLYTVDPATAKLAVESLFGIKTGEDAEEEATGPRVDVNLTTRQLLVRGTQAEIDRIEDLLQKMGESGDGIDPADRGNIRMLPITGGSTQALLDRVMQVWPTMRTNRIRTVTPSAAVDAMKAYRQGEEETKQETGQPPVESTRRVKPDPQEARPANRGSRHRQPSRVGRLGAPRVSYLAQIAAPNVPADDVDARMPEIVVAPGPGGLMIASEDTEALDAFEDLLNALSDPALFPEDNYSIYYLKYAKAEEAAKLLNTLVNGASSDGGGDGGGGGGGLADMFGGLGGLLGSAGDALDSLSSSSTLKIIPDARVNALWIKGTSEDVELIRQMLAAIDREGRPEDVQTTPVPRLIPVFNTNAADIAQVVREVYATQLNPGGQGGGQQNRQPDIRAIMGAMRGGRGGGAAGGNAEESATKVTPLSIGVDARSNSIVVSASDSVFQQIKSLVNQLDEVAIESNETTRIVPISKANPEQIQRALSSLFGGNSTPAAGNNTASSRNAATSSRGGSTPGADRSSAETDAARRRADFFNAIQRMRGGGERGGGGGGRGGDGGGGGRGR